MSQSTLTAQQLAECACGKNEQLLVDHQGYKLHKEIVDDFVRLQNAARDAGFELTIASSFRSFDRQACSQNCSL